jgi:hypothetical protein
MEKEEIISILERLLNEESPNRSKRQWPPAREGFRTRRPKLHVKLRRRLLMQQQNINLRDVNQG